MAFRASLLVTADAAQAKGELRAVAAETAKASAAVRETGAAAEASVAGIAKAAAAQQAAAREAAALQAQAARSAAGFHELRAALDPAYRGATQYASAVDVVTAAVRDGSATQAQANAVLGAAEAQFLGLSAAQQAAAAQSAAHQAAVAQMVNTFAGIPATFASAEASARAFEAEISRSAAGFHELRAAIDPVYRASKQYEAAMETAAAAVRAGTASQAEANLVMAQAERHFLSVSTGIQRFGQTSGLAGAQIANLGAQFNDIGVMLAAGQSPLQLAMQQGTQIAQVIGPMGAAGAAKALGAAFMSMLNPVMLITIGSIAAGAAMFQWLREAWPQAVELEDALKEAAEGTDKLRQATERLASGSAEELRRTYGGINAELREMLAAQKEQAALEQKRRFAGVQASLTELGRDQFTEIRSINRAPTRQVEAYVDEAAKVFDITRDAAREIAAAFREMEAAEGPKQKASAYRELYELIVAAKGGLENLTGEEYKFVTALTEAEDIVRQTAGVDMAAPVRAAADQAKKLADELLRAGAAIRDLAADGSLGVVEAQLRLDLVNDPVELARQLGIREMERQQAPFRKSADAAELAQLDAQALAFGNDKARAAQLDADRQRILAGQRSGAKDLKHDREAVEALIRSQQQELDVLRTADPVQKELIRNREALTAATGAERAQVEALIGQRLRAEAQERASDLIERQQLELSILRETDPVLKEMLRNREALVGATEAERQALASLISERQRDAAAIDAADSAQDEFARRTYDAFDGIVRRGGDAVDVIADIGAAFEEAAFKAILLGEGPLAGAFGTADAGGLFGAIAKAAVGALSPTAVAPGKAVPYLGAGNPLPVYKAAGGGHITGPGTGTSDSIPAWLSNGEFVVNASATREHRHLLEAINSGARLPRYASGGYVDGPPPAPSSAYRSGSAADNDDRPLVQVITQTSTPVEVREEETVDAGGRRRTRIVISETVSSAMTMPGGAAKRTLDRTFGVRPRGTRR